MTHEQAIKAVTLVALTSQRAWSEEEIEVWAGLFERSSVHGDILLATVEQMLTETAPRDLSPGSIITRCKTSPVIPPGHAVAQIASTSTLPPTSWAAARRSLQQHPELRAAFNSLFKKVEARSGILSSRESASPAERAQRSIPYAGAERPSK